MSDAVVHVERLGKKYRLGATAQPYRTLRDSIAHLAGAPRRLQKGFRQHGSTQSFSRGRPEFWALRDVSFDVGRGEVLGVIGRNGAGKSTLLKLLSRITEPTTGRIRIKGRVASLLEVGTGFHPELTGRENVFLNGAILGMSRGEILRKFEDIVAFAEVEQFIDTQVKHFSSGMYVRLAFSVAAHLEPDILIVDEVLAVGDAGFQEKCLGIMGNASSAGRTVLFVSHNIGAIRRLCPRTVLLSSGRVVADGSTEEVVGMYVSSGLVQEGETVWVDAEAAPGNDVVRFHAVRIVSGEASTSHVSIDRDVEVQLEYWNRKPGARISCSIHLLDSVGTTVLASANFKSAMLGHDAWADQPHPIGLFRTVCVLPGNFLNEGTYRINAVLVSDIRDIQVQLDHVVSFTVHETGAMRGEYQGGWIGVVRPRLAWRTDAIGA
jgi:lipopolysaccharide transport system ATP-binding protein